MSHFLFFLRVIVVNITNSSTGKYMHMHSETWWLASASLWRDAFTVSNDTHVVYMYIYIHIYIYIYIGDHGGPSFSNHMENTMA